MRFHSEIYFKSWNFSLVVLWFYGRGLQPLEYFLATYCQKSRGITQEDHVKIQNQPKSRWTV